jgi:sugar phosphate isomerase/epimerase
LLGDAAAPPSLILGHTLWSLIGLPRDGVEWDLVEKLRRVKESGFDIIECSLDAQKESPVSAAVADSGLELALGGHPCNSADFAAAVAQAIRLKARYVVVQVGHAFMSDSEAVELLREGLARASGEGVPMFVETHRATVTESAYRTLRLVEQLPQMRFTGDFSHWAVAGDLPAVDELAHRIGPVLDRVRTIQARISSGEQVQVDVGDGKGQLASSYVALWAEAIRRWRSQAEPGERFVCTSELGPPPYSIRDLRGREISDRWDQSLVMRDLLCSAWTSANPR